MAATIHVRPAVPGDARAWLSMRHALWPDASDSLGGEVERYFTGSLTNPLEVLLAFDERGVTVGFVELSIRPYVDGCETSRVAYLEGWYVAPDHRRRGVGRALVAAAEGWGRARGCTEFGSDALLDNEVSAAAHRALGFEETEQIRYFRKVLDHCGAGAESAAGETSLLDLVSARNGHFRLESGYHGGLWLDLDALFARPRLIDPFVARLAAALAPYDVAVVCGALEGGAFLAQLVARSLGAEFCFTRGVRPANVDGLYQTRYELPGAFIARVRSRRVAILDDVMSAGSAMRGTYEALHAESAVPVVAGALLVLGSTGASYFEQQGVSVEAVARRDYELWVPSQCPLCAAGVPLEGRA